MAKILTALSIKQMKPAQITWTANSLVAKSPQFLVWLGVGGMSRHDC